MCVQPIILKNKTVKIGEHTKNKYNTSVPCGKCPECVKAKINSWLFRLDMELERSINPLFITLTYDEKNIYYTDSGRPSLVKRDVQLFLKRLRKAHLKKYPESMPLKYYLCGEYGSKTHRPHYHAILFNCYDAQLIHECWGMGFTYSPPLKEGGTGYVLKYMSKQKEKRSKNDDREPEFSLSSKKMGENYLTPSIIKYHLNRVENTHVTTKHGYKLPLPKYYKEKIFDENMREEVRKYLQNRAEESIWKKLKRLKSMYPKKDENFYQNLLEQSKKLSKFTKRKNEVL